MKNKSYTDKKPQESNEGTETVNFNLKTKLGNGINKYDLSTKTLFFMLLISMCLTAPFKMVLPNCPNRAKTKETVFLLQGNNIRVLQRKVAS